jgi:hypothetical protein
MPPPKGGRKKINATRSYRNSSFLDAIYSSAEEERMPLGVGKERGMQKGGKGVKAERGKRCWLE